MDIPFTACGGSTLLDAMASARTVVAANRIKPFTCGIVNAKSGRCGENCRFCAQSIHHQTDTPVYPLLPDDDLIARAERLADLGVDYCGFVMSGTGPTPDEFDRLCEVATRLAGRVSLKLCASLGVLDAEQAVRLKQAGFARYHHNLETAPDMYPHVCPSHNFARRTETIRHAKAAGLAVCSGGLFGLGESWSQREALSSILDHVGVDSIPVNFLHAVPGTPMQHVPPLPPEEGLAIIAMLRHRHPKRDIVVCGGRAQVLGRFETLVFPAGANGLMVGDYLTTRGSAFESDAEMLRVLGVRRVS